MTPDFALAPLAVAPLGLLAGFVLGLVHFTSLRRVAALYLSGTAHRRALLLQIARVPLLVAGLAGLAWAGALPLLAGTLGLLIARALVLRRAREAP